MADIVSLSINATHAAKHMCTLVSDDQRIRIDDSASEMLSKMAVEFARVAAIDSAAFASHRGRKVIGHEDVMLMARRDSNLYRALAQFDADELQPRRLAKKSIPSMKASGHA